MAAENNVNTSGLRAFPKGVSGNPGGRPKGFAASIRRKTRDGEELISLALKVLRGKLSVTGQDREGNAMKVEPTIKERLEAMKWLADRGWGRALDLSVADAPASGALSPEIAAKLAALGSH